MGDITRRGLLATGAWAAPAIAVAVAVPALASSADTISLVWTPSTVGYYVTSGLVVTIPAGSPHVGNPVTLYVFPYPESGHGFVNVQFPPSGWSVSFPNGNAFGSYVPDSGAAAGVHVVPVTFLPRYPDVGVQYYAQLWDANNAVIATSSPVTIEPVE